MSENPVGERGALAMAEMLKHNTTLEELNLHGVFNRIGDSIMFSGNAIKVLVESLAVNQRLKKLRISDDYKEFVEPLSVYHDHKGRVEMIIF